MNIKDFSQSFNSMRSITIFSVLLSIGTNVIWAYSYVQLKQKHSDEIYVVSNIGTYHATLASKIKREKVELSSFIHSFSDLILSNDINSYTNRINTALNQVSTVQGPILLKWLNDQVLPLYEDLGARTEFMSDSILIDEVSKKGQIHGKLFVEVEGKKDYSHYAAEFQLEVRSRSRMNPFGLIVTDWQIIPTYVENQPQTLD